MNIAQANSQGRKLSLVQTQENMKTCSGWKETMTAMQKNVTVSWGRGRGQNKSVSPQLNPDEVCDSQVLHKHPGGNCGLKKETHVSSEFSVESREMKV